MAMTNVEEDSERLKHWKSIEEAKWLEKVDKAYQRGRESILWELQLGWHSTLKQLILDGFLLKEKK